MGFQQLMGDDESELQEPVCKGAARFMSIWVLVLAIGAAAPAALYFGTNHFTAHIIAYVLGLSFAAWLTFCILLLVTTPLVKRHPMTYPLAAAPTHVPKPKTALVIVNPNSGRGNGQRVLVGVVLPALESSNIRATVAATARPGHAIEICRDTENLSQYDAIICLGGDGTFHECVNGLLRRKPNEHAFPPICVVPTGSGNSFLAGFGLRSRPEAAIRTVIDGLVGAMDVLKVVYGPDSSKHVCWAINVVSSSPDQTIHAMNIERWRWLFGSARYTFCGALGILKARTSAATLVCDDTVFSAGYYLATLCKTQHYGDGVRAWPQGQIDSGTIGCGVFPGHLSRIRTMRYSLLMFLGAHQAISPFIPATRCVLKNLPERGLFGVDGEIRAHLHSKIEVEVVPKAVRVFVPSFETYRTFVGM